MKKKHPIKSALFGYVAFFLTATAIVTVTVLIYDAVRDAFGSNKRAIALIMLAVCFCLSLLCTTIDSLRRKFTVDRAVEDILAATEQITSGNFKVRLLPRHSYGKYDDFDLIMENLNQMAEELSKNEVLKTDFIANVSHEIKTPLAVIQNYASALQNESLTKDERRAYIKTLSQATARLTDLAMNILRLNKLENQKIAPESQLIRLDEMLAQTVFAFEELIEKKNLSLICDLDEVSVVSSPSHLEIVWNNLLSNAIKFTAEGGEIAISLKEEKGKAVVKFSDNGIGMDEETGKRIFDKFYQGDTSRAKEGNGLGLALVKKVIDVLSGNICVESELGKGTSFTVTLNGATHERK